MTTEERRGAEAGRDHAGGGSRLRLLQLTALTSTCDRFAIAPLLVVISLDLGEPLASVAAVAGAYFLAYGLMQPVWGLISDRIGRVRVMRLALLGAAVAGLGSVLAPNLLVLGVTRAVAGGCFAALIPATLVYVGDAWPVAVRQRPLSDVLAASSLGTATATAGAGLLADLVGWRVVPAVTAAAAVGLWFALARLPEPDRTSAGPCLRAGTCLHRRRAGTCLHRRRAGTCLLHRRRAGTCLHRRPAETCPARPGGGTAWRSVRGVVRNRWALAVLGLAFVEGIVVLGVLTYLAPAVQSLGSTATVAGLVAAAFGVGALGWSRLVRRLVGRVRPAGLAAIGGGFLVAAWAVPAVAVTIPTVTVAGLLVGGSWAFLHSTLQTWVTEVVPGERATAVALFAAMLFLGGAAGTTLFAAQAGAGAFGAMFTVAAVAALPVAALAAAGRAAYGRVHV